jgi:hypothetical protein
MSSADFNLTYDGPALRNHEMNVRDLAPAMLAVGELFDALNLLYNGEGVEVAVNVKAHQPGCFSVWFEVIQNWKDGALALLSGNDATAAVNLKEIVILSGGGLIWLVRQLRGKQPHKIERLSPGMVRLHVDGETHDVPLRLLRAYQEVSVRAALERVVYQPLQQAGIDEVRFDSGGIEQERVAKADADFFKAPTVPDQVLIDDTRQAAYTIISLSFKEDNKWRLHDGSSPISATIEDEDFLKRVDTNVIRFAKNDVLVCLVHFQQKQTAKGLSTEHVVKKVLRHIPAPRQLGLLPDDREDTDDGE